MHRKAKGEFYGDQVENDPDRFMPFRGEPLPVSSGNVIVNKRMLQRNIMLLNYTPFRPDWED